MEGIGLERTASRVRLIAWRIAFYAAFIVAGIFLLSPADALPRGPAFPGADKLEHLATFAALGALGARAYPDKPTWGIWLALALWGGATELAQRDIPGRSAEVLDWIADAVGALAAFLTRRSGPSARTPPRPNPPS